MNKFVFKYILIVNGDIKEWFETLNQASKALGYYQNNERLYGSKSMYIAKIIIADGEVVE